MTTITQSITALPDAPATTDPANFDTEADAFVASLATLRSEINTWAGQANTVAGEVSTNATNADADATAAAASQVAAAASAASAVAAPGTSATSTTSLTIGTGSQSLTIQTGKSFVVGMAVVIAYTTSPGNYMHGYITSYNSGTGALVVTVTTTAGSGTQAAWTVSLSSPVMAAALASITKTANYTAVAGDVVNADTSAGAWTLTLPVSPAADDCVSIADLAGSFHTYNLTIGRNSSKIMGLTEDMTIDIRYFKGTLKYTGATYGWILI